MRPMRSSFGGGGFGFPSVQSTAAKLAIGLVAGSFVALLLRESVGLLLLLSPQAVFPGLMLWQPFTYGFVETNPMGIIFGAFALYSIGGGLEMSWGSRRMLWVVWGGTALAGILTVVLSLFFPLLRASLYTGGWVMGTIAWVAYGLSIGRGQTNFWGIPITGNVFAAIGVGFVVFNGLSAGWISQVPEVLALGITFVAVRGGSPRQLWLRLQHWRLQRQLRGRSRHLRVISRERPDDRYLN
ncbi:rhomboid family intramembrane serine protease [Archangium minus]|uniref:Rhomboid family intramembrane serine protease n=1 Tax=Archangium minus TaxID=83450 RepID=A0ABY9WN58_9BACT|nr:rhomboid family intramembrane serine protease [Archangium violaceum]WNG44698.1 rhomboid family intramembrane serine protease [Archangium minus]